MKAVQAGVALLFLLSVGIVVTQAMSQRPAEVGKTSITDRTGETWDLSQAVEEGFEPERFQYGLGKNAIRPVDESRLIEQPSEVREGLRVIGVEIDGEAVAASVRMLTRHEIANISVGIRPVAVAY